MKWHKFPDELPPAGKLINVIYELYYTSLKEFVYTVHVGKWTPTSGIKICNIKNYREELAVSIVSRPVYWAEIAQFPDKCK